MKIVAQTVNTKEVEVAVSATMTISNWEELLQQLPENKKYPLYQFAATIRDAVGKIKNAIDIPVND